MADERVAESFPQVEGRQGSWSLPGAAGISSQAQYVTGQQLAVSWLPAALMSKVVDTVITTIRRDVIRSGEERSWLYA